MSTAGGEHRTQQRARVEDRLHDEFDRQLGNLLAKGYPQAAGMRPVTFMCHVEPLRRSLAARAAFAEPAVTAVAKNGGFSLAGSRCGDRRVTALWISQNRPKLGWCWAGNPHTWLGTASCADRTGGRGGPVSRTG
jgi:Family of unknown function (DUF5701)